MAERDIIIIGAGVAGLSAGYFLSENASVTVLERESQPAYHASGRSAALYIEGYENETVATLTKAGHGFFSGPPPEFCSQSLLHARGGLTAASAADAHEVQAFVDRWGRLCPNLRVLDVEEALALIPLFDPDWLAAACYDPDWLGIDVHELLQTFQRGLRARGGVVRTNAEVVALRRSAEGWAVELADGETLIADVLVNAAGAWAQQVGTLAGLDGITLQPMKRTAVLIPLPDGADTWPLVHTADWQLYFKPEGNGLMLSPADEVASPPMDAYPDDFDVAVTVDRYQSVITDEVTRVMHSWAGLRTFSPDRRPVVGFDPRASGFYWLGGQGGFGVQTSPGLGAMVAENICGSGSLREDIDVGRYLS